MSTQIAQNLVRSPSLFNRDAFPRSNQGSGLQQYGAGSRAESSLCCALGFATCRKPDRQGQPAGKRCNIPGVVGLGSIDFAGQRRDGG